MFPSPESDSTTTSQRSVGCLCQLASLCPRGQDIHHRRQETVLPGQPSFPLQFSYPSFLNILFACPNQWTIKYKSWNQAYRGKWSKTKAGKDTSLALDCNMEINYKEKTENDWFNWTHYLGDCCSFSDHLSPHFTFHSSKTQSIRKPKPVLAPPFSWWPTSPADDLPWPQMIEQSHKTLPIAPNKLHQELQPTCFHQWATKLFSSQKAEFIL